MKIAVIGSGIAGASAAWLLSKRHDVTLLEAEAKAGGHTNTVVMDVDGADVPVDTGFICYNSVSYPNLVALFEHLDVPTHDTFMSFSASLDGGAYEYSGGTYLGMVAQPSNVLRPSHWRMVADILRFFRTAADHAEELPDDMTLAQYLSRERYSDVFVERHLLPMAAAIWSAQTRDMTDYPARAFIRFFANHGLLQLENRPKWGTVLGGSRVYHDRLLADAKMDIRLAAPVRRVERFADRVELDGESFDQVVIATHAKEALAMLADPDARESELLGAFGYSTNRAVLHRDPRFMPKRKLTWASWNYIEPKTGADSSAVTYWMNSLQKLPTKENVFVTLNPADEHSIENVAGSWSYEHPIFDPGAMAAQRDIWSLQGENRTWFCGAHFGAGFHEDGLQSGLAVAEQLGDVRRPWSVENENGRIHVTAPAPFAAAAE